MTRERKLNNALQSKGGAVFVHGNNLEQKENHRTKYRDADSRRFLGEIRRRYNQWHAANTSLIGPTGQAKAEDASIIERRVALLTEYKDFLDQQHYAENFDSRSNLHSSVLEEFLYYLFKDLVAEFGEHALIGKSHTFKDLFFAPPRFQDMTRRPYAVVEIKDHDFVIGATFEAAFKGRAPIETDATPGEQQHLVVREPTGYSEPTVVGDVETHSFDVPAVAIECKTYLDKTMLEGSSRAASEVKARNPNSLYIVVMEWLKLTDAVNLQKYQVDQVYIFRKQRNTDREFRYEVSYVKNPIDPVVVLHLFEMVRKHLTTDWRAGLQAGLQRGYLID